MAAPYRFHSPQNRGPNVQVSRPPFRSRNFNDSSMPRNPSNFRQSSPFNPNPNTQPNINQAPNIRYQAPLPDNENQNFAFNQGDNNYGNLTNLSGPNNPPMSTQQTFEGNLARRTMQGIPANNVQGQYEQNFNQIRSQGPRSMKQETNSDSRGNQEPVYPQQQQHFGQGPNANLKPAHIEIREGMMPPNQWNISGFVPPNQRPGGTSLQNVQSQLGENSSHLQYLQGHNQQELGDVPPYHQHRDIATQQMSKNGSLHPASRDEQSSQHVFIHQDVQSNQYPQPNIHGVHMDRTNQFQPQAASGLSRMGTPFIDRNRQFIREEQNRSALPMRSQENNQFQCTGPPQNFKLNLAPKNEEMQSRSYMNDRNQMQPPKVMGTYPQMNQNLSVKSQMLDHEQHMDQMKADDQNWLKFWLNFKRLNADGKRMHKDKKDLKVCESQQKMRQLIVLMARLQKAVQELENMVSEGGAVWQAKVAEVERLKSNIEELHCILTNDETVSRLQQKIKNRQKKRERLKRRRKERYEEQQEELVHREQLHTEIDKSLAEIADKHKAKQQDIKLKKEADSVLNEVRKKISDSTKSIDLLSGLRKLCKLRKEKQERQGLYTTPGVSQIFERKIEELEDLMNRQRDVYEAEETALKVMLETEQEESREKEREKARQKQVEMDKRQEKKHRKMIFGDESAPSVEDPVHPFYQYYNQANLSLEGFVNVRHGWDTFLVPEGSPGGSRIPSGWVIPVDPISDVWASTVK